MNKKYDVVIMGAGFAGICQARHLMLKIPNIQVALIDPRPANRSDKDMKIGESMVEVAALFVTKELGLNDYMIEEQTPKIGLSFHWPKNPAKTGELNDYYHVWANRQTSIASFHFNRAKFERDVLEMTRNMGVHFIQGRVIDVELTSGDASKTIYVDTETGEPLEFSAKHVVDAAGKKFIIGKKTDNLITGADKLYGVDNATVWMRFRNVDRTIFFDGHGAEGPSSVSRYYGTNHWFGHGHWLWMIPTDKKNMELSVGVVYHKSVIDPKSINSKEKFLAFLEKNHKLLFRLVKSGVEVDFVAWNKLAYRSKMMFSNDNWYCIGDAAYILDAFYSYGTTTIAFAVEGVTEVIRAKLASESDAEEKCQIFNDFNLAYSRGVNLLIRDHDKQLGNASTMSWRIYFEYMWWFGVHVPMYIGKWHLNKRFAARFVNIIDDNIESFFPDIYAQFNQLINKGKNIGLMDCYRADQLLGNYCPLQHYDNYLENTKLEPLRTNVFAGMKYGYLYIAFWYLKFQWRGFRMVSMLKPKRWGFLYRLLSLSAKGAIGEMIWKYKTRGLPNNTKIAAMHAEFRGYRYQKKLNPW